MTDEGRFDLPPIEPGTPCDTGCGAAALVKIVLITGDLYMCGHHYANTEQAIANDAVHIHDERGALGDRAGNTNTELEPLGRMCQPNGLRSVDQCRWCCTRLELRRAKRPGSGVIINYVICPICEASAAHVEGWTAELSTAWAAELRGAA